MYSLLSKINNVNSFCENPAVEMRFPKIIRNDFNYRLTYILIFLSRLRPICFSTLFNIHFQVQDVIFINRHL